MEKWKELKAKIEESIEDLQFSLTATECWVVVGNVKGKDTYIFVGEEFPSINNSQFAVITAATAHLHIHFENEEQAIQYGFNHYLRDGGDRPIHMKSQRLSDYAKTRIEEAQELIIEIDKWISNGVNSVTVKGCDTTLLLK